MTDHPAPLADGVDPGSAGPPHPADPELDPDTAGQDLATAPEDPDTAFSRSGSPDAPPAPGPDDFQPYSPDTVSTPAPRAREDGRGGYRCPRCAGTVEPWAGYCESCGQVMTPQAPMPMAPQPGSSATRSDEADLADSDRSVPTRAVRRPPRVAAHPCRECGGEIGADNYCQVCGTKGPDPRDHYRELPADWVAGVCDRGIRHHRNEDAMAIAADEEPDSRAVLVVCDGVSTAEDSDVASLAAARTARGVLVARRPDANGTEEARLAELRDALLAAADQANHAVVSRTPDQSTNASSCTFVAAVVDQNVIVHGNLGDSRAYWLDDRRSAAVLLTTDDSVAQARIAMGVDRESAENGPQAHAITKWLGRDSPDTVPAIGSMTVPGPGWLLVCSDGLWNYASDAGELHDLVTEAIQRNPGNARARSLAVSLTRWARLQGGKDNITVALARLGGPSPGEQPAPAAGLPTAATPQTAV